MPASSGADQAVNAYDGGHWADAMGLLSSCPFRSEGAIESFNSLIPGVACCAVLKKPGFISGRITSPDKCANPAQERPSQKQIENHNSHGVFLADGHHGRKNIDTDNCDKVDN